MSGVLILGLATLGVWLAINIAIAVAVVDRDAKGQR